MIPARLRGAVAVTLFSALFLLVLGSLEPGGAADTKPQGPEQQVDALFSVIAGQDAPGASALVLQSGRVLLKKGYGFADLEHRVRNTPETKFRLGSVTKSFTALAILQLSDAGKLRLDDPIGKYLADAPHGDQITVRHLLTHTSGVCSSASDPLEFTPGERINYSNTGYKLLGKIVEAISGTSWEDYLQAHVFAPAGMRDTGCDHAERILPHRSAGYFFDGKSGYLNVPPEDIAQTAWAAGALYSTVEDMARFQEALSSGTLLQADTLAQAFTPGRLNDGSATKYGFGWMIADYRGVREICHGGDTDGHNAAFAMYPDQGLAVIVLSNVCMRPPGPLPTAMNLGHSIAEIYLGDQMQPETVVPEIVLAPEQMQAFVGRYRLEGRKEIIDSTGGLLTVEVENGRVMVSDKANRAELVAESATVLHLKADASTKLRFTRDPQGRVTGLILRVMDVVEVSGTKLPE